jgi:hypothetical protein
MQFTAMCYSQDSCKIYRNLLQRMWSSSGTAAETLWLAFSFLCISISLQWCAKHHMEIALNDEIQVWWMSVRQISFHHHLWQARLPAKPSMYWQCPEEETYVNTPNFTIGRNIKNNLIQCNLRTCKKTEAQKSKNDFYVNTKFMSSEEQTCFQNIFIMPNFKTWTQGLALSNIMKKMRKISIW